MASQKYPQTLLSIPYIDPHHSLQTLDLYLPRDPDTNVEDDVWIILLHGGAWRDPLITSQAFLTPLLDAIFPSVSTESAHALPDVDQTRHIAAIASISYRLSSYPSHPTAPSSPDDAGRNVQHPTHLRDVLSALKYLREQRGMRRWIAVGHSCGANLAIQALGGLLSKEEETGMDDAIPLPLVVVSIAGMGDLPALVRIHADQPVYREIVANAFGEDEEAWVEASPVTQIEKWDPSGGGEGRKWRRFTGYVLVAHSQTDGLVEWDQLEGLKEAFNDMAKRHPGMRSEVQEIGGQHDDVWQEGTEMGKLILKTVRIVRSVQEERDD